MADIVESFLRGGQQAQAEQEHVANQQQNKLKLAVLKHQINEIKLQDQLRQQELVKGRSDLGLGQDDGEADLSTPARPAGMTGMPPSQVGGLKGTLLRQTLEQMAPPASGTATAGPAQEPDHLSLFHPRPMPDEPPPAQGRIVGPVDQNAHPPLVMHNEDTLPDTHAELQPNATIGTFGDAAHAEMKRAGHTWIPGLDVPELGIKVPGMWYSAKAAREEQARRAIALKRAERNPVVVGPGATALDTNMETGALENRYTNPNAPRNVPLNVQYKNALDSGDTKAAENILKAIHSTQGRGSIEDMLLDAQRNGNTQEVSLIKGVIKQVSDLRRDPNAAADRQDAATERAFTRRRSLWAEDVAAGWKKHAEELKAYNDPVAHPENLDPSTAGKAPAYEPPSFSQWVKEHPEDIATADAGKGAAKTPAAAVAKAPAQDEEGTLPAETAVGDFVTQGGKRYRVKALAGGKVSLEPAKDAIAPGQIVHYKGGRYKIAAITNGQAKLEPAN